MDYEGIIEELERPAIYVVAVPIGNVEDITLRGLKVLRSVDMVFCEERKVGSRLLKLYGIKKELREVNEHNEKERYRELIHEIISENLSVALISDAGTPMFADPGNRLIPEAYNSGVRIIPVPGASSLMAALMSCGVKSEGFLYYGFLPANRQKRQQAIRRLPLDRDVILLEAPYRLKQITSDLHKHLGSKQQAVLAWRLTHADEEIIESDLGTIAKIASQKGKGEFVLILRGNKKR